MKRLVAPDTVAVLYHRRFTSNGSRGLHRPPCFTEIDRDCGAGSACLYFSDGSSYTYFPDAIEDAKKIVEAPVHGSAFNAGIRRQDGRGVTYNVGAGAGFPCGDVIYSYPPYPGNPVPDCVACVTEFSGGSVGYLEAIPTLFAGDTATVHTTGTAEQVGGAVLDFQSNTAGQWKIHLESSAVFEPHLDVNGITYPATGAPGAWVIDFTAGTGEICVFQGGNINLAAPGFFTITSP